MKKGFYPKLAADGISDNLGVGISAESELDKGTVIRLDLEQYEMKKE